MVFSNVLLGAGVVWVTIGFSFNAVVFVDIGTIVLLGLVVTVSIGFGLVGVVRLMGLCCFKLGVLLCGVTIVVCGMLRLGSAGIGNRSAAKAVTVVGSCSTVSVNKAVKSGFCMVLCRFLKAFWLNNV
jgi:hypothetical protein